MKAKRVWTVCLAVLTLLALLAGCGKQAQVQPDPSPEPDSEPALFDGSFDLVLKSEYQGDLPEVNFRLATDEDGKRYFFSATFLSTRCRLSRICCSWVIVTSPERATEGAVICLPIVSTAATSFISP